MGELASCQEPLVRRYFLRMDDDVELNGRGGE